MFYPQETDTFYMVLFFFLVAVWSPGESDIEIIILSLVQRRLSIDLADRKSQQKHAK